MTEKAWARNVARMMSHPNSAAPKIYEDHGFIYTVFTRPTVQEWNDKVGGVNTANDGTNETDSTLKSTLNSTELKIVELLAADGRISMVAISTRIGLSREGVRKAIKRLKEGNVIRRIGPAKGGHWEICD